MKRKLELDQFFIALEATVSHQIAEAIAPPPYRWIDKGRWWNRWATDRQRYKLLMERGGIFPPPYAHDWIPENPVHAMAAARVLDCFGLYWVPR